MSHTEQLARSAGEAQAAELDTPGARVRVRRWLSRSARLAAHRVRAIRSRHGTVANDAVLTVFLAGAAVARLPASEWSPVPLPWLAVLLCPLIWRRTAPITVFAVTLVLCTTAVAPLSHGLIPAVGALTSVAAGVLLIALATVAAHRSRATAAACAGLLVLWGFEVLDRWSPHLSQTGLGMWLCAVCVAALAGTYTQMRRAYVSALRERAAHLEQERDQQARMAAVEERARIARELHDIVSHNLSVMIVLADGAAAGAQERNAELMRQVARTGRQAVDEMRHILGLLREDEPLDWTPQPGIDQLDELIEEARAAGLPTRLRVAGTRPELGPGLELTVYRIVQEGLTNIRKHARGATRATVDLGYRGDRVELEIADDGLPVRAAATPGHGLAGMRERAAAFAGSIEAGPAPDGGWRVRVLLAGAAADRTGGPRPGGGAG